jgi:hypothetical protein
MPHNDPAAYRAWHAAYQRRKRGESPSPRPPGRPKGPDKPPKTPPGPRPLPQFLAVDGEGTNQPDGSQWYTLLCASDGTYLERYTNGGLHTTEILLYLMSKRMRHRTLCGFFLGYDVAKWLSDMPVQNLAVLWKDGWTVWEDDGIPWYIKYVPSKIFEFGVCDQPYTPGKKPRIRKGTHTLIYDVGGFFQCSFVKALREWKVGTPEQVDRISGMKEKRNDFVIEDAARIRAYCAQECTLLVSLMDTLARTLWSAQIELFQWHGSGAVAEAILSRHATREKLGKVPAAFSEAVLGAYFGGRSEIFRQGVLPLPLHNYDINSAYPTALLRIPILEGATWERVGRYDPDAAYALWDVAWDVAPPGRRSYEIPAPLFGPFPYRRDGRIRYPYRGRGWYHAVEVRAAMEVFGEPCFRILGGIVIRPIRDDRPFSFVADLAATRLEYKQRDDPRHRVLKLGLNSLYGKQAQKQVQAHKVPKHQNHYVAGYITAHTRAALLRAMHAAGTGLCAVATDGLFTTSPVDVAIGSGLGEWEHKGPIDGVLIAQSGVLYTPDDETLVRTRGFAKASLGYAKVLDVWLRQGHAGHVVYTERRFIGLGGTVGHARFDEAGAFVSAPMASYGRWIEAPRELVFRTAPTKLRNEAGPRRLYDLDARDAGESIVLVPEHASLGFTGTLRDAHTWRASDAYTPGHLATGELAQLLYDQQAESWERHDQPDWDDVMD